MVLCPHPQILGQVYFWCSGHHLDSAHSASHTRSPSDNQFRMSILERLEQMEKRMAEIAAAGQAPCRGPDAPPVQVLL